MLLGLCLVTVMLPPQASAATEHHLFDPTISLTGSCIVDEADAVPDPWCPGPPAPTAKFENSYVTINSFGDMYVSSRPDFEDSGRVDVFSPSGDFITELQAEGATSLAVDSKGNLYVNERPATKVGKVTLFRPTVYEPEAGKIAYGGPGEVLIEDELLQPPCSKKTAFNRVVLAVNPLNDRLFVSPGGGCVAEWSSAEEGPELLDPTIGVGVLGSRSAFIAVDAALNRLYVTDEDLSTSSDLIQVFELSAPHAHIGTLDGHDTPNGKFLGSNGWETIAADEATGNLIVSELVATRQVFELGPGLGANEELLNTYEYAGFKSGGPYQVAVDNSPVSPNFRTFYIPSRGTTSFHTFAFRLSVIAEPEVESIVSAGITETEAILKAVVNPGGGETGYRIEYTTQSAFEADGFEGAVLAAEGSLPAGIEGVPVAASLVGLAPGTSYRFRVSAENEVGADQLEGSFRTYSPFSTGGPCPNEAPRAIGSANLPDCRAYELVSPADTNGLGPLGAGSFGLYFPTLRASLDGTKASFRIEGGAIPGFEAAGSPNGDNYLATRTTTGWTTEFAGGSGTDAITPAPGGFSPDQGFSFWGGETDPLIHPRDPFIRYPDGHSERVGRGSLGVDPEVEALQISQNASHTIFNTVENRAIRLEPAAPPAGTATIYDRTADEVTHVVSLLPGDITPAGGESAIYVGASLDGEGVAFRFLNSNVLYLRQQNTITYEIGSGLTYAGIAEGGGRIFYLKGGNLFAFDTASKSAVQFSKGGDTTAVNISADGSTAYFLSPDVLTGAKQNPNGAVAQIGKENLYVSDEGVLAFVGTVEPLDVKEPFGGSGEFLGLGLLTQSLQESKPGLETSRTTADGHALLFESRAPLAGYDPDGHTEIYRYDLSSPSLTCLSCSPTGTPATGNASLETIPREAGARRILGLADRVLNVRPDGDRAFFQSYEPLVLSDVDGKQDVYEWEAQGVGSCTTPGGCVYLISSGQSERDEHLFAASESGDDVFFLSGDLLLGSDKDSTPSIYDARVGGGFPEGEAAAPCQGEGCRAGLAPPPLLPAPATPPLGKSGNVSHGCGKGKRKVRRHGKVRCVKKRHHHTSSKGRRSL
jgi:hypothetical protein